MAALYMRVAMAVNPARVESGTVFRRRGYQATDLGCEVSLCRATPRFEPLPTVNIGLIGRLG